MSDIKKDHSLGEGTGAVAGAVTGAAVAAERFSERGALDESLPARDTCRLRKSQCLNRALPKVSALTPDARIHAHACNAIVPVRSPRLKENAR